MILDVLEIRKGKVVWVKFPSIFCVCVVIIPPM